MGGWDVTAPSAGPGTYALASWLFLRLLGLAYLVAFTSLAIQVRGLAGRNGLLPVAEFLTGRQHWGSTRFWRWPSLCWLSTTDATLLRLCWAGAGLALLLILGLAPILILVLLWICYLSLFTACRLFLHYQWDILLLEAGFLAVFVAPPEILTHWPPRVAPPSLAVWLLWWLLFRLMFWSGAVKLRSGDRAWRGWTALQYHYETQPLPTVLGWYLRLLPAWFHKGCVGGVLALELVVPFFIPLPPFLRHGAAALLIGFMLLIELTGNYAFFNFLGIALSVLLLDDQALLRLCRPVWQPTAPYLLSSSHSMFAFALLAALLVAPPSVDSVARLFRIETNWPRPLARFLDLIEPFHVLNSYGLFAVMTTWRNEIVLEGSNDGHFWQEYQFKWKPGDPRRRPRFVAPHQPRLDWQMWFLALGAPVNDQWFERLRERLREGAPAVLSLLRTNPFPESPPRYVRAVAYTYRFSLPAERRADGSWWHREFNSILRD